MFNTYFPNIEKEYFPIIEFALEKKIQDLILNKNLKISKPKLNKIYTLIGKAKSGVPIPYLIHKAHFFKDEFFINKDALIPRPETEFLVQNTIEYISSIKGKSLNVLDACTGSGCVGISISKYVSDKHNIFLLDLSTRALRVCRINIQNLVKNYKNIQVVKSDLLKNLKLKDGQKINVLISNPPYIPIKRLEILDKSVKGYEPYLALFGGEKGYEISERLLKQAKEIMAENFLILIEIDEDQGNALKNIATEAFPESKVEILKDLFRKDRYLRISN